MPHESERHIDHAGGQVREGPANELISPAERRKREAAVNFARASLGLEGFKTGTREDARARRFINGEIDLTDFVKTLDEPGQP